MPYGTIKIDTVTFTDAGVDKSVSISGLVQNPTFSGNVTVAGTLSGVTVTGTTANFTSGNFTNISGGTHTITSGVFAAGSAASPSITFTGDLNTGIYSPGADQVAISTNGTGRLFVDASGNIGTGSAPTAGFNFDVTVPSGDAQFRIRATDAVSSDADARLILDAGNTGEAEVSFRYQGVEGGYFSYRNDTDTLILGANTNLDLHTGGSSSLFITPAGYLRTAAVGSAASPAYSFQLDTNTGIYSPGADQVAISTGGYQRLLIDPYGIVTSGGGVFSGGVSSYAVNGLVLNFSSPFSEIRACRAGGNYGGLKFYTQGANSGGVQAERMTITTEGFVGIGTSSPSNKFTIYEAAANPIRLIQDHATSSAYGIEFYSQASTPYTVSSITASHGAAYVNPYLNFNVADTSRVLQTRMVIDQQGRVGIGNTGPQQALHVTQSGGNSFAGIRSQNSNTGTGIAGVEFSSDATYAKAAIGLVRGDANGVGSLVFYNASSTGAANWSTADERARIDSSGRLLVGTSTARSNFFNSAFSPLVQFEGANNDGARVQSFTYGRAASSDGPIFILAKYRDNTVGGNTVVASGDQLGWLSFQGSDGTQFVEGASIRAEIDGTPSADDMPGRLVFSTTRDGQSSPSEACRIDSSQRLLVGRTGPDGSALIQAPATSSIPGYCSATGVATAVTHFEFRNSNGLVGTISTNASATAYNTSSDYRLKENVAPVTDGITRLQQLKPSRFSFIADPTKTVDGFLAHEAAEVVPECVTGEKDAVDDDGNPIYQGIDQSKLVPLLTAALQEAVAKIESLETRLTAAGI